MFENTKNSQEFDPSFLGIFLNDCYLIRKIIADSLREHSSFLQGRILDYGCGSKPYESFFNSIYYVGIDVDDSGHSSDRKKADVFFDGHRLPFDDSQFDGVLASEVFEHVFNLSDSLREIFRVLKPGGCVLFTCPFVWPLHEAPYDYARYTPYSLEALVTEAGFQIDVKQQKGSAIEVIGQMVILEVTPVLLRPFNRFRHIRALVEIFLTGTVNGACRLVSPFFSGNGRLYLSNVFVIRKPY